MNIDKLKDTAIDGLEKVVNHLETDDGKRLLEAINATLVSVSYTWAASRGLRKISRRFGTELTRKEAYGLVIAGASVIAALDPGKHERIKNALAKPKPERKIVVDNRLR